MPPASILRVLAVALALAPCLLAGDIPRSVEELPIDRFDEYPAGALPPHPWFATGSAAPGLNLVLQADGESPFVGNKVTGKGLVLTDDSSAAGRDRGIACEFTPPPAGELYLGFDFLYRAPATGPGLGLRCELTGPDGQGLRLGLGEDGALTLASGTAPAVRLADLAPATWYHLAATIRPADTVSLTLTAAGKRTPLALPPQVFRPAAGYTRLAFRSAGPDVATGAWTVDNICMAGNVGASRQAWWPFDRMPVEKLQRSPRKAFAYYFIYTSAYSDEDPGLSWYTRTVLNPSGNNKPDRAKAGTELLYRPLPRPPMPPGLDREEIRVRAMADEIRLARQQGLDGFLVDFWAEPHPSNGQSTFSRNSFALLDAAQRVDPNFKILPAVYSNAAKSGINGEGDEGCDPVAYAHSPVIQRLAAHPAALRLSDGRLVFSQWLTERHSPAWWRQVMAEMARQGHPIALLGQFNSYGRLNDFSPLCFGMAHWGPRVPGHFDWVARVRELTGTVVFPICEQDVRTRGTMLWEAGGSQTLRDLWEAAIADRADWVFLNTWSDYSEQAMQPSTGIGFAPYDLNAYYLQWFKTGVQPPIVRDTLYYFYRKNHSEVPPGKGVHWKFAGQTPPRDEIELLAFLAAPGKLRIRVAENTFEGEAAAGISVMRVPLPKGMAFAPEFALWRDGQPVVIRSGRYAVLDRVEFPNMLYGSGVIAPERPATGWWRRTLGGGQP